MLCGITLAELSFLAFMTPTFTVLDWIYVLQHVIVFGVALTRYPPRAQDYSWRASMACLVSYAYPYAQILYLGIVPGSSCWPQLGQILVVVAADVSLASLLTLGRWFGIRPALRGLTQTGPYRLVRHPLYLAYLLADVGASITASATFGYPAWWTGALNPQFFSGLGAYTWDIACRGSRRHDQGQKMQPLQPCTGPKAHPHRTKGQLFYLSRSSTIAPEHG